MDDFKRLDGLLAGAREVPAPESSSGNDLPPEKISGVPVGRIMDTFESFDLKLNPGMKAALERCQKVGAGEEWCAFLTGGYGTGKTHLAIGAMHVFGMSRSYFWKVPDYLDWLKRMAFDQGHSLDDLTKSYRGTPFLLVLDDLGAENPTDWAHEQLYRVLDARCDMKLPTILTTNTTPDRIDGRIQSRYAEGLVVCKGADVRRTKRTGVSQ